MEQIVDHIRSREQWYNFVESCVWRHQPVLSQHLATRFSHLPGGSGQTDRTTPIADEFWNYCNSLNVATNESVIVGPDPVPAKRRRTGPSSCEKCGETFNNRESRRLHRIKYHSTKDKFHHCPVCSYRTLRNVRMVDHMRRIHTPNVLDFAPPIPSVPQEQLKPKRLKPLEKQGFCRSCEVCKRVCPTEVDFKKHMKTHEVPVGKSMEFPCDECAEKYTRRYNLKIHKIRKHGEVPKLDAVQLSEEKGTMFDCSTCHEEFASEFALQLHQRRRHTDPIPGDTENILNTSGDLWLQTEPSRTTFNKRFGLNEETVDVKLSDKGMLLAKNGLTLEVLSSLIAKLFEPYKEKRACLSFITDSRSLDRPIATPYVMAKDFDTQEVINSIEKVLQSAQDFSLENPISISVKSVIFPEGCGKCKPKFFTTAIEFVRRKTSTWDPRNSDNNCFSYCVAGFMLSRADRNFRKSRWFQSDGGYSNVVREKAADLRQAAAVADNQPCGLTEWIAFQEKVLTPAGIQLVIFSRNDFDAIVFGEGESPALIKLHLVLADNHFLWVLRTNAYLRPKQFCEECCRIYSGRHQCLRRCTQCRATDCDAQRDSKRVYCKYCKRSMKSESCYSKHRINGTCGSVRLCLKCLKLINTNKPHEHCGERKCNNCDTWVRYDSKTGAPHLCYIAKLKPGKNLSLLETMVPSSFSYIFYDYETYVDAENGRHIPMLVVAQHVCNLCICSNDITINCPKFGKRQLIFEKEEGCESFALFLFFDDRNRDAKAFAHNGSRYDCYFLLNWLIQRGHKPQALVNVGNKILMLKGGDNNVELKDTFMFFTTRLSSLPGMFGLKNLAKGDFPHKFNKPSNWSYSGKLPGLEFYHTSSFKTSIERQEFERWHAEHSEDNFDFMPECVKYCTRDVDILRQSCIEFRKVSVELTGIDPLSKALTAANFCSKVFRNNYVNDNEIGILPRGGYTPASKQQSLVAIKYLMWLEHSTGMAIIHAGNSMQEPKAGRYSVDGVYVNDTSRVVQVYGCFWHGCIVCYPHGDKCYNKVRNCSMSSCYEETIRVQRELTTLRFTVDCVWEHEIKAMLKTNNAMKLYFEDTIRWSEFDCRIAERDGLFGGRTNAAVMLRELTETEIECGYKILYYDFCSLYPTVQKRFKYPTGHPQVYKADDLPQGDDFTCQYVKDNLFGVVKAKVLAPKSLLFPVLPAKIRGKLCFALCRTCAEENNNHVDINGNQICDHIVEDRAFVGVWMSPEVEVALENGYKFVRVYEAWHYPTKAHLFSDYVNNFLTVKAEASGWPDHPCKSQGCSTKNNLCDMCTDCMTAREKFVQEYKETENVTLDPSKVSFNAGKRSMAKIWLNSLWGKLTENPVKTVTQYLQTAVDLRKLLLDDLVEVMSLQMASPTVCVATTRQPDERDLKPFYAPVVGSFVTTYGRLELFRVLKLKSESVLYYDTDSVIFVQEPNSPRLTTGNMLGDLTDELKGDFITKFCSSGPKSYSYVTSKGCVETKIKGISIRNEFRDFLDFETVKAVTLSRLSGCNLDESDHILQLYNKIADKDLRERLVSRHVASNGTVVVPDPQMVKCRFQAAITSNDDRVKFYRLVYDKRVVLKNYRTVPFGYHAD